MKNVMIALSLLITACGGGSGGAGGGSGSGGGSSSSNQVAWSCPQNHHTTPTIIIMGDSMAAYDQGWAEQFARMTTLPFQNFAIGGTRMEQNNQYPTAMCIEINSNDFVVWQPGINDAYAHHLDAGALVEYEGMLNAVLDRIELVGARAIFGTTIKIDADNAYMDNATVAVYAEITRRLVTNRNNPRIQLVDGFNTFDSTNPALMSDTVHPSIAGYTQLANEYFNVYQGM